MPIVVKALYIAVLIIVAIIDWRRRIIPNVIVYPMSLVAVVAAVLWGDVVSSFMAGLAASLFFGWFAWACPKAVGWGDVKMAGLIGLMVDFPNIILALALAFIAGAFIALPLLARGKRSMVVFGPALAIGGTIALIWGSHIMNWYMGLF